MVKPVAGHICSVQAERVKHRPRGSRRAGALVVTLAVFGPLAGASAAGPTNPTRLATCAPDWATRVVEMEGHRRSPTVSAWLANGVRIHHMAMDQPAGQVVVTINLIGGELLEGAESRGISLAAARAWDDVQLRGADQLQIRKLLEDRDIHIDGASTPDALQLRVRASREDIEVGMRIATELLKRPDVKARAIESAAADCERLAVRRARTEAGLVARALAAALFPTADIEPRTSPPRAEHVRGLSVESVQKWLDWHLEAASVEAAVVGDIPLDEAMRLMAGYLGQMPQRARIGAGSLAESRKLPPPKQPIERRVEVDRADSGSARVGDGGTGTELAVVGFVGSDAANPAELRTLRVVARLLDQRVSAALMEEGLIVGSVNASAVPATVYPGFGAVAVSARADKPTIERVIKVMGAAVEQAASAGFTEQEVDAAGDELARTVTAYEREPRYWSGILARSSTLGVSPDELADGQAFYRGLTAAAVNVTLRRNATSERMIRVVVCESAGHSGSELLPER